MASVSVRYIVEDVDAAIEFYVDALGFTLEMHPAPAFAMLSRGDLRLVLSAPGGGPGGGQAMPDGTVPAPGGWNRFQLEVDDLDATRGGAESQGRRVSKRHRRRRRRQAGAGRRSVRKPGRAVPADAPGSALGAAADRPGRRGGSGVGRSTSVSTGAWVRIQVMSLGVNPSLRPWGAGAMMRVNGSFSQICWSAWVGVRPFSMRASTGTPARSAAYSTASSSGIARATSASIGASGGSRSGTTSR